jgi:peptidoglycan/LPS O-acetylase OafA/YrhL
MDDQRKSLLPCQSNESQTPLHSVDPLPHPGQFEIKDSSTIEVRPSALHRCRKPSATTSCIRNYITICFTSLKPSFISPTSTSTRSKPLHSTAYLNGLRGVAALIVVIHHYSLFSFFGGLNGYHGLVANPADGSIMDTTWILQLPFIRLLHSGRPMVAIFFVISGYVLSYKPLSLIRADLFGDLLENLSTAVFRRAIRLFGPIFVATFISALSIYMGFHDLYISPRKDSLVAQLWDWFCCFLDMIYPFSWDMRLPAYDDHLWTIPVEFRGSLVVFLTVLGLAYLRSGIRLAIIAWLALTCFWRTRWDISLFLSGVFLCELGLIRAEKDSCRLGNRPPYANWAHMKSTLYTILWILCLVFGVYLACFPFRGPVTATGYATLHSLTAAPYYTVDLREWYWLSPAAVMIIASLENVKILQRPFTTGFAQYLGRISFSIYVVHGPVFVPLYSPIVITIWNIIGYQSTIQYAMAPILGACIMFPIVFCVADVFWRLVDINSVKFAQWVLEELLPNDR